MEYVPDRHIYSVCWLFYLADEVSLDFCALFWLFVQAIIHGAARHT